MKIKHMLAVTALILIFAVTACTQYVFEFPTDKEITTVEDLVKFMQKHEKDSAKVNLTIDPDNSYLPITINGNKTITGKITIKEDSPFPFPFSSVTTYATKAGATNLFEIADNASLSVTNFEASVTSNAADSINSIITINDGSFESEGFSISGNVIAVEIGPTATMPTLTGDLTNLSISVNKGNPNAEAIAIELSEKINATIKIGEDDIANVYNVINTTSFEGYKTLEDAFKEAGDNDTIKVLNDTIVNNRINITRPISLDLNGKTISASETYSSTNGLFFIGNGGNFTINDSSEEKTALFRKLWD